MTEAKENTRLMCSEIVGNNFHMFANQICDEVPEIKSLALVIDWRIGRNDLPFGAVYFRDGEKDLKAIFGTIEQTRRMLWHQVESVQQMLTKLEELYVHNVSMLNASQKELEERQAKVEHGEATTQV